MKVERAPSTFYLDNCFWIVQKIYAKIEVVEFSCKKMSTRAIACAEECAQHRASFPDVRHLTAVELQSMLPSEKNITIVDVRAEGERRVSMLPGAIALNQLTWPPEAGSKTVFYCTVGYRSSLEARRLAARAPKNAELYSMAGILDWAHAGGALVDASGQPTVRLHAFGSKWAAMAPEKFDVETFDSASCSFFRAILRVVWLVVSWPVVWACRNQGRTVSTRDRKES